jgi:hypothetical protein
MTTILQLWIALQWLTQSPIGLKQLPKVSNSTFRDQIKNAGEVTLYRNLVTENTSTI